MNQQVIARVSDDADTRVSCRVRKREDSEAGSRVWCQVVDDGGTRFRGTVIGQVSDDGDTRSIGRVTGRVNDDGGTRLRGRVIGRVSDEGDTRPVGRVMGRVNDDGGIRPCNRVRDQVMVMVMLDRVVEWWIEVMKAATQPGGRVVLWSREVIYSTRGRFVCCKGCGPVLQEVQDDGTRAALVEYVDLIRSTSSN